MSRHSRFATLLVTGMMILTLLWACGSDATPAGPASPTTSSPAGAETSAPAPTKAQPSATSTVAAVAKGPSTGGTLVVAMTGEPDTFDPHRMTTSYSQSVLAFVGASFLAVDPKGNYVPYLAESWTISDDGLTYEFKLKKGVKFHDGSPLTAEDAAWSLLRATDPEIETTTALSLLGPVGAIEAVDDSTVRIQLQEPYYGLLSAMAQADYLPAMPKAYAEKVGDGIRTAPVSAGPYVFKEYSVGEKVVIERNPDYTWGPTYAHQGPWYIQTIEYRILPEYATVVGGLETGELDYAGVQTRDVERLKATGQFQALEAYHQGMRLWGVMNTSKAPFDDLKVRQAFNLAMDRQAMIKAIALGDAVEQKGPLSRSVAGYWSGVEQIGYGFDLPKAEALMKEAGYVAGADGILAKDGVPLHLDLQTIALEPWSKVAEMMQANLKALGVDASINVNDPSVIIPMMMQGQFELGLLAIDCTDAEILFYMFHSSQAGAGYNVGQVNDAELDELTVALRMQTDAGKRQTIANDIQKLVVEQAYTLPLYTPKVVSFMSNRVKGIVWSETGNSLFLSEAYIGSGSTLGQ